MERPWTTAAQPKPCETSTRAVVQRSLVAESRKKGRVRGSEADLAQGGALALPPPLSFFVAVGAIFFQRPLLPPSRILWKLCPPLMKIGTLNVRALRGKFDDIIALIEHHSLDILCITETHLHDNIDNCEISIDNFTLMRRDRNCHGGGVAIYATPVSFRIAPTPHRERAQS